MKDEELFETEVIEAEPMWTPHIDRMKLPEIVMEQHPDHAQYKHRYATMRGNRVDFLRHIGYEIVTVKDTPDGPAHPVTVDQSVLMRVPMALYERRARQKQLRARAMTSAPRERVKNIGERMDVQVTDQTRERRAPFSQVMLEKVERAPREGEISREQMDNAGLSGLAQPQPVAPPNAQGPFGNQP